MQNPILLVDTWEGQGSLDLQSLKNNGVSGIIVAINSYTGALQFDSNFVNQYNQALSMGFTVIPYLVYSPYHTAQEYFNWLVVNMPLSAKGIMIDTELTKTGYSPNAYSIEYSKFISLVKTKWNVMIYTGEWFLPNMNPWPKDIPYWFSEYPNVFYPSSTQSWSWDQIRNALLNFNAPLNNSSVPNPNGAKVWQFSGDKIILPGSSKPIDIDVFLGTMDELIAFAGNGSGIIPTPIPQPSLIPILVDEQNWNGADYKKYNININRPTGIDNVNYYIVSISVSQIQDIVFDDHLAIAETSWFTSHHDVDFATNGWDGWSTVNGITSIGGFASYHGKTFGRLGVEQTIFIDQNFNFSLKVQNPIWTSCSFPNLLIQNGQILTTNKTDDDVRARTAWGLSKDGQTLVAFVCDGLDYYSHHGFNFKEVQNLLLSLGCYIAWMSDGGGSTTLCKKNSDGSATVVNVPSGENSDGQRSVAIHCGIKMKGSIVPPASNINGKLSIDGFNPINIVFNS